MELILNFFDFIQQISLDVIIHGVVAICCEGTVELKSWYEYLGSSIVIRTHVTSGCTNHVKTSRLLDGTVLGES